MARRTRAHERGAAAVEFAILLPLLILVIGGIIDFGRYFYTQNIAVNGAREGARMLALGYPAGSSPSVDPSAYKRVDQALIGYQGTGYTPTFRYINSAGAVTTGSTAACPTTGALPGDHVQVQVQVNGFSYLLVGSASSLFGGGLTPPVPSGTADVRCGG